MTIKVNDAGAWKDAVDIKVLSGGSYRRVVAGYTKDAGAWKQVYTYTPAVNTSVTGITVGSSPMAGTAFAISGTVTPVSGSIPVGSQVELWNGGTKLLTTTTASGGTFTFSVTLNTAANYTLTVKFLLSSIYQPSQANTSIITVKSNTSVSFSAQPTRSDAATTFTVAGNVLTPLGQTVNEGTITLYYWNGSSWVSLASQAITTGAYSLNASMGDWPTSTTLLGSQTLYLEYGGGTHFNGAGTTTWGISIERPQPQTPTLTASAYSGHTSVTLAWTSVNATSFDVYKDGTKIYAATTASGATISGLSQDTSYVFSVVGLNENSVAGSSTTVGHTLATGHAQVTKSGTVALQYNPVNTDNWRSDGWGTFYSNNEMVTGTFGSNSYRSLALFNSGAESPWHSYVRTHYGSDVADNANVNDAQIFLHRLTSGGSSGTASIDVFVSNSTPGTGGSPVMHGTANTITGPGWGNSGWSIITDAFGQAIYDNTYKCIGFANGNYSAYYGLSNVVLKLTVAWNFVATALLAATWT